jgi:hypothetical protein
MVLEWHARDRLAIRPYTIPAPSLCAFSPS